MHVHIIYFTGITFSFRGPMENILEGFNDIYVSGSLQVFSLWTRNIELNAEWASHRASSWERTWHKAVHTLKMVENKNVHDSIDVVHWPISFSGIQLCHPLLPNLANITPPTWVPWAKQKGVQLCSTILINRSVPQGFAAVFHVEVAYGCVLQNKPNKKAVFVWSWCLVFADTWTNKRMSAHKNIKQQ